MSRDASGRNRIVVQTQSGRYRASGGGYRPAQKSPEIWVAVSIIAAAILATFVALFITSRPYNPMTSSFDAQQTIPQGPLVSASPKASPSPSAQVTPTPVTVEVSDAVANTLSPPDDTAIQAQIEKSLAADAALAQLDVSTVVESGRVMIVGSVRSAELKQRVERVIKSVKGVTAVDNQLVVIETGP